MRIYLSNTELHDEHITCFRFSEILETRFRFIETDQYHYQRLLEVKQRKDEDALSLSDRVKLLAQKILPSLKDPAVQNAYQLLRLYMALDQTSTAVQLHAPRTMERAIEMANTVYFTFKSKNDTGDAHINFTGRRYHDWRSMSCSRRFQVSHLVLCAVVTEYTASAQQGCGITSWTFLASTYQSWSITSVSKRS